MKKYLLSLLLVGLSFIWFSNAWVICSDWVEWNGWEHFEIQDLVESLSVSYAWECFGSISTYVRFYDEEDDWIWDEYSLRDSSVISVPSNAKYFYAYSTSCSSEPACNISYSLTSANSWGGNSWGWNIWNLLPWGETALSGAISWLSGAVNEFIPYLVYITLWLLSAIIWFVAIKWLLRYTKWKTLGVFKSRRKK